MRDTLVAELDVLKTERLRTERRQATTERLKFLHGVVAAYEKSLGLRRSAASDLRAEFGDLAMMPAFRSIVELPACEPVTEQDFANWIDTIPALQAEWLRERQCEFEAIVSENAGGRLLQYPMVTLAIVSFRCGYCKRDDIRWPNVLAHSCGRGVFFRDLPGDEEYRSAVASFCLGLKLNCPWGCSAQKFTPTFAPRYIEAMIRACGRDPCRVTYDEMQSCGKRLYCKICSVPSIGYMQVYDWKNAVSYNPPSTA